MFLHKSDPFVLLTITIWSHNNKVIILLVPPKVMMLLGTIHSPSSIPPLLDNFIIPDFIIIIGSNNYWNNGRNLTRIVDMSYQEPLKTLRINYIILEASVERLCTCRPLYSTKYCIYCRLAMTGCAVKRLKVRLIFRYNNS